MHSIKVANFENENSDPHWMDDLPIETRVILKLDNAQRHFSKDPDNKQATIEPRESTRIIKEVKQKQRYRKTTKKTIKKKASFTPKSLTKEQVSTSIVKKPAPIKVHYDGKSYL